jgi:hypothetical protein
MMGAQDQDFTHPNFLGHYLAAKEISDFLVSQRGTFIDPQE